jgi:hypothetical protein
MKSNIIKGLILTGALSFGLSAQTVNQREENQQDRIAQGVKSGQLTPGETSRLEGREGRVDREVNRDRRAGNGHLTAGERARVNRQQNRMSKSIYRDKHNNRVQ